MKKSPAVTSSEDEGPNPKPSTSSTTEKKKRASSALSQLSTALLSFTTKSKNSVPEYQFESTLAQIDEQEAKNQSERDIKKSPRKKEKPKNIFKQLELKITGVKQLSRINMIAEILTKVKKINRSFEKFDVFDIDDILVEMAILQMSKNADALIFYFTLSCQGRQWKIRKSYSQIKKLHLNLGFWPNTRLPIYLEKDPKMYLRMAKYLSGVMSEIKKKKDVERFKLFLEGTYNFNSDNVMGEVIKSGWARKKIGGRYTSNKIFEFAKQYLK